LYARRLQQLYDLVSFLSIFLAAVVTVFSHRIVTFLYGGDYAAASPILTIYVWSGVSTFLGIASSQYLTAENFTKISLYRTLIGMVLNVFLNLLLIPGYGITGSALATLISYTASTFSVAFFPVSRRQFWMMLKSLMFPRLVLHRRVDGE